MSGWVAFHRSQEAEDLQSRHPNAFLLLCQIARRARWKPGKCPITGMEFGQAQIGDFQAAGLSSIKAYRHAKEVLERAGIVAFRGASRGTVATLMNTAIFSVGETERGQQKGQQEGIPGANEGPLKNKDRKKQQTPSATDGASSTPPQAKAPDIAWDPETGFSGIRPEDWTNWGEAYPAVNLPSQAARASEWLKANPSKRKKAVRRFLTNWFSRSQERGGDIRSTQPTQKPEPIYRA